MSDHERYAYCDPNDPEFQLGRSLFEAQVLYADAEKGPVDPERVKEVCARYQRLISLVGPLRMEVERQERRADKALEVMKDAVRKMEGGGGW